VPAARTKLLEGQWVLWGGVNVVGWDMMQAGVFRYACNVNCAGEYLLCR
jgi:hypothetical protein